MPSNVSDEEKADTAARFLRHLGVGGNQYQRFGDSSDLMWIFSHERQGNRPVGAKRWSRIREDFDDDDSFRLLAGKNKSFVCRQGYTCLIQLDLDHHNFRTCRSETLRERMGRIAAFLGSVVGAAKIVVDVGNFDDVTPCLQEQTAAGIHLGLILDQPIPIEEAAAMALRWKQATIEACLREEISLDGVGIDAFPTAGGSSCTLPLSVGHRVVGNDLGAEGPAYRSRYEDALHVLRTPRISVKALRDRLDSYDLPDVEASTKPALRLIQGGGETGQLFKSEFVVEALRLLDSGLRDDESWHGIRTLVAAGAYVGLSDEENLEHVRWYLRRGGHAATHCQTEGGIRQLLSMARSQIRHFNRGLHQARRDGSPRTWRNGLKSTELRNEIYGALGIAARKRTLRPMFPQRRPEVPRFDYRRDDPPRIGSRSSTRVEEVDQAFVAHVDSVVTAFITGRAS